jgi:hypothetical protein
MFSEGNAYGVRKEAHRFHRDKSRHYSQATPTAGCNNLELHPSVGISFFLLQTFSTFAPHIFTEYG